MSKERAEILATDHPKKTAARIVIAAPAKMIFDVLAGPYEWFEALKCLSLLIK